MKRRKGFLARVVVLLLALAISTPPLMAAGTVDVTQTGLEDLNRYSFAWTSTAGGAVSGNPVIIARGYIVHAKLIPGAGGTQPTDLYDALLTDDNGVDLLIGAGANLSNVNSKVIQYNPRLYNDGNLDLVISNAGASKTGTFILYVAR
jgi:hypothetical protein